MKIVKFCGKCLLIFIVLILIFWTVVLATLQTKRGQEWAYQQLIGYLEQTTQTQIQIAKFKFSFPLHLTLEKITISQDQQPFLTIQKLDFCCAYSHLLQGKLVFSKLYLSEIDFLRLPHPQNPLSSTPSTPWDAPPLPFYVKLENIDIQRIHLGQQILNQLSLPSSIRQIADYSSLNLRGTLTNNPFREAINAHLLLTATSESPDLPLFTLGIDTQNHYLSLSLHFNQVPLHALQADLPRALKAHLAIYASAPVTTWQNLAQQSSQNHEGIDGHLKLFLNLPATDPSFLAAIVAQQTILRSRYLITSKNEIEFFDLKIDNPHFFLEGSTILTSHLDMHQGKFKGGIENLAPFQQWIGKEVQGQLNFEGEITGSIFSPALFLNLESPHLLVAQQPFHHLTSTFHLNSHDTRGEGVATLDFDHQTIPWKFKTSFDWNDSHSLTLSSLQLNGLQTSVTGQLHCSFPDFIWEGLLEADTKNLSDISHFLATPLSGAGQLKIQLAAVNETNQQKRQKFSIDFQGQHLQWMEGQARQLSLTLQIHPMREGKEFFHIDSHLEAEQLQWKEYTLGHCLVNSSHEVDSVHQKLFYTSAEWKSQNIQWPGGQAAQLLGQVHLKNPLQTVQGNIQLTFQNIQTPTFQLDELALGSTLSPSQMQWPFYVKGRGAWKEKLSFTTEGTWHYHANQNLVDLVEVYIQHLSGQFGPYPLQLLQPMQFSYQPHAMHLKGLWLKWGKAELQASFKQDHAQLVSQFKTNAIPSELFHFIDPDFPLTGRAIFQGELGGTLEQPQGHCQIDLQQIQFIEDILVQKPFIAGTVHLDLNGKGVQVKSQLTGIGQTPVLISGYLPLTLSLSPFNFKTNSHLPFELAVNAEGKLDPYLQLFYHEVANLSGQAKIAFKLSGQMNKPQIQGHMELFDGTYESLNTGALYHNIQAYLEGDGSKIILKKFSAQDNKKGMISATGSITVDSATHFPFDFQIQPAHIYILDSDYATIATSGSLRLNGNSKQSKLQGELTVDQAAVRLEETLPNQFKTVDIKYINLSQGEQPPTYLEKKEAASPVELDIKVQASHILMEGNHIKSDWKGSVQVTGTSDKPQAYGDLQIVQGEYDFNGKIFNLSQGQVHFAGAVDKKTTLYVVASKDIERIRADIIVKGLVTKPVISFRSNPPLSQREVLSYILFNRGISDITSDQGEQLSQSFISLNATTQPKGNDDFLSHLRNNIGIDRLDFTTNDTENKDIGLQIGKNLTDNIFVSFKNLSMVSLSPVVAVEVKLRKNLRLQAETGFVQDAPVRMSIKWKKDY